MSSVIRPEGERRQLLEVALRYAEHGWPVVPLHTPSVSGCSCSLDVCSSPGKHPRITGGLHNASDDGDQIRSWWRRWPDANVGVVTGAASGLVVLDIDLPDGPASLARLTEKHGPLPSTCEQRTGSGGLQLLFAHPGHPVTNRTRVEPGIDVRGDGGYIVVPPSLHASGTRYRWTGRVPAAPAPGWLLELLERTRTNEVAVATAPPQLAPGTREQRYAASALHQEVARVASAVEGSRNDTLNRAAFNLGQLAAAGLLSPDHIAAQLEQAAVATGLPTPEVRRTITSGLSAGLTHPRNRARPLAGRSSHQRANPAHPSPPPLSQERTMPSNRATIEDRRAAAEAVLERELRRLVESGEYGEWFRRMSLFRRYAPTNSLWIMAQLSSRPDAAGIVAPYRTWQELGRQVRKGERGIMVWYPKPYWIDPATGDRVRPPASEADRARLQRRVSFGVGHVFDLSATEGEPLPQLGRPAPDRAPQELADHLDRYCRDHRITVEVRELREGLLGHYQRDADRVVLDAALSPGERLTVLAHELAHREDPELIAAHVAGDRGYYAHNRPDCEAVAEAAAHTMSARFKHDITGHSAGYIAGWIGGDIDRFKPLHERVGQVTRQLVPPDHLDQVLDAARSRASAQARLRTPAERSR